jgi:hypothetical protein
MCHLCPKPPEKISTTDRTAWFNFTIGLALGWLLTCAIWQICTVFDAREREKQQHIMVPAECEAAMALTKHSLDALDECHELLKSCAGVP